jgi:epoxyqueuosine reductase QueG
MFEMVTVERIISTVCETVEGYGRSFGEGSMWREPVTAFADSSDPLFGELKQAVSPGHLMPGDILPDAKTVICFFIPFCGEVIKGNETGEAASRQWAVCYIETNILIKHISEELAALLGADGFRTGQIPATHNFDEKRLVSDWSHRHAAWIAGLGSFGENNMLITEKGCCGRFGSLVTDWPPPKKARQPEKFAATTEMRERCLNRRGFKCGLCRKKCPAGAYRDGASREGIFDRHACYARCLQNAALHSDLGLADVCGKCLCGLPCSSGSPMNR